MLAPELPLKLSAAGIRFTGYMVERQLRIAQVYCDAMLKSGIWSRPLTAKAAVPIVPTQPAIKLKAVAPAAKPRRDTRAPVASTIKPVVKSVEKTAAPVAPTAPAKPAPVAKVDAAKKPVASPVASTQSSPRVIPVDPDAPKRQPSTPPAMPGVAAKTKAQ